MIYGLIIAAGKQSRFESSLPKALTTLNGECLLDINLKALSPYCDVCYVVCSIENEHYFDAYENRIVIHSGLGCGHAVMNALKALELHNCDTCFIQWGDSKADSNIYKTCIDNYTSEIILPCTWESSPYVQIIPEGSSVKVMFSKYNDKITEGYHDLSVFYGNAMSLLDSLQKFHNLYWKDNYYTHPHGNELQFLDVFNEIHPAAKVIEVVEKSFSFNTQQELKKLLAENQ